MQIEEVVQFELNKLIEGGTIEKIISTQLESTVKSVFNDALKEYSEFGKQLKEAVGKALSIDLTKLTLLDYNSIICAIVKEELDKCVLEGVQKPVAEAIKNYVGILDKREWKLSEIIESFVQNLKDRDNYEGELTLIVDIDNWGTWHVHFDEDKDKKMYDCEYQLDIDKTGKVYSFKAGKYLPHRGDLRDRPIHGSFDAFIFKLYAAEAILINDEGQCVIEWSMHD